MIPLLAGEPERCPAGECVDCHRRLKDPVYVALGRGRDCAAKRGIVVGTRRVRLARVRYWLDIDGQGDLFPMTQEEIPDVD
jgi:hypothetical protein